LQKMTEVIHFVGDRQARGNQFHGDSAVRKCEHGTTPEV
jgi:hypothetical protein